MRLPGLLLNAIVMMMTMMMMIMVMMMMMKMMVMQLMDGALHMGAEDCRLEKRATIKLRGEATGLVA